MSRRLLTVESLRPSHKFESFSIVIYSFSGVIYSFSKGGPFLTCCNYDFEIRTQNLKKM